MPGTPRTISEKILSAKAGRPVQAGEVVIARVDRVLGTDASTPMALDYFAQMGGERLFDPKRVTLALDHYSPPDTPGPRAFHERMRAFAERTGAELLEVGEGISFQRAAELGRVLPGDLVVGADSHTVTCGALNLFAVGVGSSDLAAAMLTGAIWLKVPETIRVVLVGTLPQGVSAKDLALAMVKAIGAEGADYQALEFTGPALPGLDLNDRFVLCNLAVECGAKAAIFPFDAETEGRGGTRIDADRDARYVREVHLDLSELAPRIALPHAPDQVVPLEQAIGTPVHMVFIGTCTGGRVKDFHTVLQVLERGGGRLAPGVQLVLTPASREVETALREDGTLAKLELMGAIVTTTGCGACCGTSGVLPSDGMNVLSTANRNFKGRMGNLSAAIYLASPAACAAAALNGRISDPRALA
jgi:3-isopropylmalate/(R)-2-methylmalate dehydratase large subunit